LDRTQTARWKGRRMNTAEPMVRLENLVKTYGEVEVLRGMDLAIAPREKVSVIGPSGSGKSTMLRMLMTLEKPTSGEIWIDGDSLWHMRKNGSAVPANRTPPREIRGQVGMVFPYFSLFPHMTVLRNVTAAPIHVQRVSKKEAEDRARSLLDQVGLG